MPAVIATTPAIEVKATVRPVEYRGYTIKPKGDFGGKPFLINGRWVDSGFVVSDGLCNVMPGATWFLSVDQAKQGINVFIEAKGDADTFWRLMSLCKQFTNAATYEVAS